MKFSKWIEEKIQLAEESLPKKVKELREPIKLMLKGTPLVISVDDGKIGILGPDYSPLLSIGMKGSKFIVTKGTDKPKLYNEKDLMKEIESVIKNGAVF